MCEQILLRHSQMANLFVLENAPVPKMVIR